jgi:hypothetical protein
MSFGIDRNDAGVVGDSKFRKMRAYRVSDVGRREMGVMFFSHARVGVTELRGDNA